MQIEIISFTEQGSRTAEKIEEIMEGYHQTQESGKTAGGQSMEQSRKTQSSTKYSSNSVQRSDGESWNKLCRSGAKMYFHMLDF